MMYPPMIYMNILTGRAIFSTFLHRLYNRHRPFYRCLSFFRRASVSGNTSTRKIDMETAFMPARPRLIITYQVLRYYGRLLQYRSISLYLMAMASARPGTNGVANVWLLCQVSSSFSFSRSCYIRGLLRFRLSLLNAHFFQPSVQQG